MLTHIFFHKSDADGWCSGALMKMIVRELSTSLTCNVVMYPWTYGDNVPLDAIGPKDTVMLGDITFPPEIMAKIYEPGFAARFYWWDHHKDAVEGVYNHDASLKKIQGKRCFEISAAAIIHDWMYVNCYDCWEEISQTDVIKMVSLYDTWQHKDNERILNFAQGISIQEGRMPMGTGLLWTNLMTSPSKLNAVITAGQVARKTMQINCAAAAATGTTMVINSFNCFVVNTTLPSTNMFSDETRKAHDVCFTWYWHAGKKKVCISARSVDDKSALKFCKLIGGSGHNNAAGARIDSFGEFAKLMDFCNHK